MRNPFQINIRDIVRAIARQNLSLKHNFVKLRPSSDAPNSNGFLQFLGTKQFHQHMDVKDFDFHKANDASVAKAQLIKLLQDAHAGEKAAALAYFGHAHSLFVSDPAEKQEILKIQKEELHHRARLGEFLLILGSKPRTAREIVMWAIGATIAIFSYLGTWLIPMYGAGKLERSNIGEYEVAARLAFLAGATDLVDELLYFAEIEWDHESYFRKKIQSHFLSKWIPLWPAPKSREEIRSSFENR